MSSEGWPAGVGLITLAGTDSTNAEAARRLSALSPPVWIMAHRQDAGRGRQGRRWQTLPGNLAATLVIRAAMPAAGQARYSFVAALAVHDALVAATGRAEAFALKWPNDVLMQGGKLAGILLESLGPAGRHLAIGVGVNLAAAPALARARGAPPPVALAGSGGPLLSPEDFLPLLARAMLRREAEFAAGGFAPIRAAWLARAAGQGAEITARTGAGAVSGRFEGVDETGALLMATAAGCRRIAAADVFLAEG